MLVLGVMLVMSYNQVPNFSDYWSSNSSLGNEAIKNAISRNRCLLLFAKMYFNDPEKDANAPKTYYMDEVVACFKKTFMQAREDSPFQSIDESMAKFKGRSSLKQYLPLKPIKRGIKVWERCDAATGYTYDFNIYSGKDMDNTDHEGTILGERVVLKLSSTIRNPDVTLTFDRFFTSVNLLDNISFPSVGTCISRRKDMPKFSDEKLQKGDSEFLQNRRGTLAARWQDSKEVLILSNCHGPDVIQVKRKQKDGEKVMTNCPTAIADYNRFMGGVDLSDQKICLYDFDRRSTKWWKKVFYKLLMTAVVNAHILFQETKHRKIPLLQYIVPLAELMIAHGKENAIVKRKKSGRPSNATKLMLNVGDHLPLEGPTRRRCARCAKQNKETRTKTVCAMCLDSEEKFLKTFKVLKTGICQEFIKVNEKTPIGLSFILSTADVFHLLKFMSFACSLLLRSSSVLLGNCSEELFIRGALGVLQETSHSRADTSHSHSCHQIPVSL
ncbi:PiggyBac transposable element-derived protein 4, partial [Stegodyphus mimosarum]